MPKFLALLIFILFSTPTFSSNFCQEKWDDTPIQQGGRVKTFFVAAKENIKFITGKSKIDNTSAQEAFCLLTLESIGIVSNLNVLIPIEHKESRDFLGLSDQQKVLAAKELINSETLIRSEIMRLKKNTPYKKDLTKVYNRILTYKALIQGHSWSIPKKIDNKIVWHSFFHLVKKESLNEAKELLKKGQRDYTQLEGDDYLLENILEKSHLFSIAMLVCLIGIFVTTLSKNLTWPKFFTILTLLIQITGITLRVFISGRAPITNMYETVLFSGFGALLIALIILFFKKDKTFLLGGLGYNILCLFMMKFSGGMLDSSIGPLVPVLRDNFWLSTHVTTIILSYAALALSWIVANIALVKGRFSYNFSSKEQKHYQDLIYTCMKIGVILLATGIILGGVWADYSWGRFWGWDPKETWSLIVFLFYMAILHARTTNWMSNRIFINLASAGFMSVMMAWFGVNYILATGLHSYGFSEGGAIFLGTFFLVQTLLIIFCNLKLTKRSL